MNHTPTTLSDVLSHVTAEQAKAQERLDVLFAQYRAEPLGSDQHRWLALQVEEAHGKVLAFASIAGYLEARIDIDKIYTQPLPA